MVKKVHCSTSQLRQPTLAHLSQAETLSAIEVKPADFLIRQGKTALLCVVHSKKNHLTQSLGIYLFITSPDFSSDQAASPLRASSLPTNIFFDRGAEI